MLLVVQGTITEWHYHRMHGNITPRSEAAFQSKARGRQVAGRTVGDVQPGCGEDGLKGCEWGRDTNGTTAPSPADGSQGTRFAEVWPRNWILLERQEFQTTGTAFRHILMSRSYILGPLPKLMQNALRGTIQHQHSGCAKSQYTFCRWRNATTDRKVRQIASFNMPEILVSTQL